LGYYLFYWIPGESLVDRWRQLALLRYFEIWGNVSTAKFLRAVAGKPKLRQSFAGMIGGLNSQKVIQRTAQGEWKPIDLNRVYPHLRRLPSEGVENARAIAWKLADVQRRPGK